LSFQNYQFIFDITIQLLNPIKQTYNFEFY